MSGMARGVAEQSALIDMQNRVNQMYRPNINTQMVNPYIPSIQDLFPQGVNPMQGQVNPMSFGAARFLQANTNPVTLDYNLPMGSAIPQFNVPRFKPGNFYNDHEAKIRNEARAEAANTIQAAMDAGTMGTG
jgi:hypothetical protein